MNRKRKALLGIITIVVLSLIGCNKTDVIHNQSNVESSVETTNTSNSSEDDAPRTYTKTITRDDVVGYWHGRLGNLSIFLYEGTSGEIQFLDNHGSAYLIFEEYSNEENGLVFDVDPASTGYENVDAFSITIFKVDGETLDVRIGEVTHEFKKINEDEFFEDQPMEYFGEVDIPAEEKHVLFLQDELMSLSDDEVEVGTLMNNYDYTNTVYTSITYKGLNESPEHIRETIIEKVKEMNNIADQYRWLETFVISAYLNNGVPGETEKDKQVNTLTPDRLENQENRAFFIATSPEDRWVLSKKNVSSDNFAGYTLTFTSNEAFAKDRDQGLQSRQRYPLYTLENINGLTVLLEAYTRGISTDVQDEIDSNNHILETSTIKNYLGYWHYKEMNQYFEITFDEFGGMIHESTGYGYSFTISNETNNEIELALGTGEIWKVTKDGNSLLVGKSDGYDMTLHSATKGE